ncbi:BRO family protein [Caldifermentibacillus hisashii]|uniref:BRO family protein n=1 Tax=Caldifermentibacillus hisashii TaxID=996558 RepID=A0ABU9K4M8_9BACI
MENDIKLFKNDMFGELYILIVDGKEYFPATDVAKILGYADPHKAIKQHTKKDGWVNHPVIDSLGRNQEKKFINEGNLYRLIVKSKLPEAEKFEQWVFDEILPTIRKTGGYVSNDEMFISTYLPFADDQTKLLFKGTLETVRKQNEMIQRQQKEIEYKEDVIINLVDEVTLAEKRQILNRVVRRAGKENISKRWKALYDQFEMKYHVDLERRLNTYNNEHKPKLRNKLDYIDKVMNKIPEIYEIACKLYENDIEKLVKEMYDLNKR